MKKGRTPIVKKMAVILSVAICMWALADRIYLVSPQAGKNLLMHAAGMGVDSEQDGSSAKFGHVQNSQDGQGEVLPFLDEDGVVSMFQQELPKNEATPDPNRASLPVEEIFLNDGAQVDNFKIKDSTYSGTDIAQELLNDPTVKLKADGEVEVLLYHTHTTEAYMENESGFYYTDMNTRSQNQDMNVVAVGEEIKKALENVGIGVVHDTTVNDTLFSGSYSRSWEVLQNNLQEYPGIQVTIDIHRDSMTTDAGVKYKPTAEINGRKAAQVMIMAGCDINNEWGDFPDWLQNLRFALRLQQKANEIYPGLTRPMNFSNNKYNMNATTGSVLIEVGTEVNSISEAKYSGQLMGEVLAELLCQSSERISQE